MKVTHGSQSVPQGTVPQPLLILTWIWIFLAAKRRTLQAGSMICHGPFSENLLC
ncbi:unnamed protein product [Effrenium voratum]|nr:unnamed protein product [Effrenium voratum]